MAAFCRRVPYCSIKRLTIRNRPLELVVANLPKVYRETNKGFIIFKTKGCGNSAEVMDSAVNTVSYFSASDEDTEVLSNPKKGT
jgi:hypothetical protein